MAKAEVKAEAVKAFSHKSSKSGTYYFLHSREVTLKGGRKQVIYFFAKMAGPGAMSSVPAGYEVGENEKSGLPLLRKKA